VRKILFAFLVVIFSNLQSEAQTLHHQDFAKKHPWKKNQTTEKKQYIPDLENYLQPANQKMQISDWLHPTKDDYFQLQNYLSNAPRPELGYANYTGTTWRGERIKNFKLISEEEDPEFKILYINGDPTDKTNCIVTYISYNGTYKKGLLTLLKCLENVGFNGHVIYRIGGWPDTEEGSLELFDVPYAFKVFSMMEARRLGYKNCLWLDVSFKILKPLDKIFQHIDHVGGYFQASCAYSNKGHIQEFAANALGYSLCELLKLPAITASVIGLNFHHPKGEALLNSWHEMAKEKIGFLSFTPEQLAFTAAVGKLNLWEFTGDKKQYSVSSNEITMDTALFWDRGSID
jgi:hypothetical protein